MKEVSLTKEILDLYKQARKVILNPSEERSIQGKCHYLKNDVILCLPNPYGDIRYPYSKDGLTLWAYASGNISINESNFFVVPLTDEGKEPYLNFYAGLKNKKDKYDIYSLTGNADTEYGDELSTYVIYTKSHCYYIRVIDKKLLSAVKLTITDDKRILFTTSLINLSKKTQEVLSSMFFNPLLTHNSNESEETRWFRKVEPKNGNALFTNVEDISREIHLYNYAYLNVKGNEDTRQIVNRRMDYVGNKNKSISLSKGLRDGKLIGNEEITTFTDMAIYGDIAKKELQPGECLTMNYQVRIAFSKEEIEKISSEPYDFLSNQNLFKNNIKSRQNKLSIEFGKLDSKYNLNNELFNNFLRSVIDQVDYSSTTKNSSLMLLGIRDIYQMMEVSLLWDKESVRRRILESLTTIDPSGRAPRQYSSLVKGRESLMDNRAFIDQGNWIISTVYKYLAFTNDCKILKEKCGYCKLIGRNKGQLTNEEDTVYDHLLRIINYLLSNIDENTGCLKALYGDWNDAVDGLGQTDDKSKDFGNGVSVMASCHLYRNLIEMHEINKALSKEDDYVDRANKLEEGILKHAILVKNGHHRIVHGWGENKKFYVGSYHDVDGENRTSVTSNAAFVMSGLLKNHPEYREMIYDAYKALDSKYGLLTFDKYFDKEKAAQVGRIVNLPKGTAENSAVYIHGAMFFVRALLMMNETELAFDQILKLIPITHEKITTSPFVMPNSYGYNKELNIDGESMSDWYTGSSNTLLKAIIFDMFGINPSIGDNLTINPVSKFPSDFASIALIVKNKKITLNHYNNNNERVIYINGKVVNSNSINLSQYKGKIKIDVYN